MFGCFSVVFLPKQFRNCFETDFIHFFSLLSIVRTLSIIRPPCINGDIAVQWEWSNFDPLPNQNPLTDYDKTLHSWLRPRDEHVSCVTQNLCQSTVRERLDKYVKYKALSFFILIHFFPDSPTEVIRGRIFTQSDSNYAQSRKEVPFLGSAWPKTFRGSNSPKTVKIGR